MRHDVLATLKATDGTVSGETLARALGISRVAVWKQVRELRSLGYRIESSSRGYQLLSVPDLPLPCEFPGWESKVHYFPVTESTMQPARLLARNGAAEGTLVIAGRQMAGRGRLDRSWVSPEGGIYMTLVLRPVLPPAHAPRVNLMVAVAVSAALEKLYRLSPQLKWPNDVLIQGRKLCGILAEMEAEADAVHFINVGIGLNANAHVTAETPDAVSLMELLGGPVNRVRLTREIVEQAQSRVTHLVSGVVLDEWRRRSITLGREVRIVGGETVTGIAVGIDGLGALLVRDSAGRVHEIVAGDCVHARH